MIDNFHSTYKNKQHCTHSLKIQTDGLSILCDIHWYVNIK